MDTIDWSDVVLGQVVPERSCSSWMINVPNFVQLASLQVLSLMNLVEIYLREE
jgi:hypothetical protein